MKPITTYPFIESDLLESDTKNFCIVGMKEMYH